MTASGYLCEWHDYLPALLRTNKVGHISESPEGSTHTSLRPVLLDLLVQLQLQSTKVGLQ